METVLDLFTAVRNASYARGGRTPPRRSDQDLSPPTTKSLFHILMQTKTPSSGFDHLVDRMSLEELVSLNEISPEAQMCLTGELPSRTVTNEELVGIVEYVVEFFEEVIPQHLVDEVVEALNAEANVYLDSLDGPSLPSSQEFRRRTLRRLRRSEGPSTVARVLKF